jgi:hypothetical protein
VKDGLRSALIRGRSTTRVFRRKRFADVNGSPANRFLSLLLVAALLACHGAFGALHQLPGHGLQEEEHSSAMAQGAGPEEHPSHHGEEEPPPGGSNYAAVIFVVLLGAALALRLGGSRLRVAHLARWEAERRFPTDVALYLPRGPTAPVLQVFRL